MKRSGLLYWITGLAGSGKTTIGNRIYYKLKQTQDNVVLLDGDILKTIVDSKTEYTASARKERAYKYAKLCKTLTDQGLTVICCTIAMFEDVRKWNRANNKGYVEVFLDVPLDVLIKRDKKGLYSKYERGGSFDIAGLDIDVEFPKNPDILLCNDGTKTIEECANIIIEHPIIYQRAYDRDTQYWNNFYEKRFKETTPSLFAECVLGYLKPGNKLLDLGC